MTEIETIEQTRPNNEHSRLERMRSGESPLSKQMAKADKAIAKARQAAEEEENRLIELESEMTRRIEIFRRVVEEVKYCNTRTEMLRRTAFNNHRLLLEHHSKLELGDEAYVTKTSGMRSALYALEQIVPEVEKTLTDRYVTAKDSLTALAEEHDFAQIAKDIITSFHNNTELNPDNMFPSSVGLDDFFSKFGDASHQTPRYGNKLSIHSLNVH